MAKKAKTTQTGNKKKTTKSSKVDFTKDSTTEFAENLGNAIGWGAGSEWSSSSWTK